MENEKNELLTEHKEFNKKMESAATEEEAMAIMKEYGFDSEAVDEELSEGQLDNVSGGTKWRTIMSGIPVFDSLPGRWPHRQKIQTVYDKGRWVLGEMVTCRNGMRWIEVVKGEAYVNIRWLQEVR